MENKNFTIDEISNQENIRRQLIDDLSQFTGTENYYRYYNLLLTDGARYLAEAAGCFWLMDSIWAHVVSEQWLGKEDFITCKLNVRECVGTIVFDDGNENVLATQQVPYTDFPLEKFQLYIVREDNCFVIMLPGEY